MIALDTNILARYLLRDDREQYRRARALLKAKREYWVPITVILEVAWVLKNKGVPRHEIAQRLQELLKLKTLRPQLPEAVYPALHWTEAGLDFADALHLALSQRAEAPLSFDAEFIKRAAAQSLSPTVTPA